MRDPRGVELGRGRGHQRSGLSVPVSASAGTGRPCSRTWLDQEAGGPLLVTSGRTRVGGLMLSTTPNDDIGANCGKFTRCHARSSSAVRSSGNAQCGLTHALSSEASSAICPSGVMETRLRPPPVQMTTLECVDPKTVTSASDTLGAIMAHTSTISAAACATARIRRLSLVTEFIS